ncbi:MAG TPA: hypothetical protein VFG69_18070 [Nannocystaceae bacterium]|nr:hypothetical protein [Nannocystaceae bacterium]
MGGLNGNGDGAREELDGLLREARQHEVGPSWHAQGRAWAGIQRRLAVGPPAPAIERFSLGPTAAGGGKLVLLVALITWIGAAVLGGVAASVVVDGEAAAGAPQVATRTEPQETDTSTATSQAMVVASDVPFVQDDEPIVLFDEGPDPEAEIEIVTGRPRPRAPARSSSDLAAETRMLRGAQAELREGSIAEATELLAAHRRQFPRGLLVDLRAALEIDALCRQGQHARAQSLLRSFAQRYPNSPYRARVQACGREVAAR